MTLEQVWLQAYCAALQGILARPVTDKENPTTIMPGEMAQQFANEAVLDFKESASLMKERTVR